MTEPIDHAAEARATLHDIDEAGPSDNLPFDWAGASDDEQWLVHASLRHAQVHATLALVATQDRANELKRIEILAHISYGPTILDENRSATVAESEVWQALHDQTGQQDPLAPSIARSLGLGGESDGE